MKPTQEQTTTITLTANNTKTIRVQEVEIEFTEWMHPMLGVIPIDPNTPLILKAKIREEV
jgi:hypothetical protein